MSIGDFWKIRKVNFSTQDSIRNSVIIWLKIMEFIFLVVEKET